MGTSNNPVGDWLESHGIERNAETSEIAQRLTVADCERIAREIPAGEGTPSLLVFRLKAQVKFLTRRELARKDDLANMRAKPNPHLAAADLEAYYEVDREEMIAIAAQVEHMRAKLYRPGD